MRHVLLLGSASLASSTIPVLVDSSLRWGVVFVFAVIASVVLCRASAAVRHIAWMFSLSALLLMPVLVVLLPDWRVLPWKSSDSMAALASHSPTTGTVDAKVSLAQSVDSTELDSTIHPLTLEVVNDKSDDRGTTISNFGQIPKRVDGWLTLVDKLGLLWIVGVVICVIRLIASRLVVRQLASRADQAAADPLMASVDSIRERLGLESPVRFYVTPRREMPMAWGIWRPSVLLPQEALSWDKDQLEAVLLHELGHIRRRDPLTHIIAQLVCALHWFNPLVWYAAWRLGVERERACDDLVLRAGLKASTYAEQLLAIVSRFGSSQRLPCTALAMAQHGRLDSRIAAILDPRTTRKEMTVPTFFLTLLVATATTFAAATLNAQQGPAEQSATLDEKQPAADAIPNPLRNPGFEEGKVGGQTVGWHSAGLNGYRATISDKEPKLGAQCGLLRRDPGKIKEKQFGALNSGLDVAPFRGKRVRFRAAVRTKVEGAGNHAQLWLRVDRPTKDGVPVVGAFDNMHDRPITATQWQYYEIVADVAPDARGMIFGLLLMGDGKAFIDDASLEVVDEGIEPTAKVLGSSPSAAMSNLGPGLFEIIGSMEVVATDQSPTEGTESTLLLPLPLSYRDQVPLSYQLSADPPEALKSVEIYQDQPKNFVAKIVLSDIAKHKKVDLNFRSSVLVGPSTFDDVPATVEIPQAWPDEAEKWLASTWCVEAENERIQSIAKQIRDETDDVLQVIGRVERKAKSIFRAAEGHVQNLTAVEALDKRGSCTSCGNLVAALLRACDVPARVLSGYPSWSGPLQTHYIVEAYVPGYGWYPVESTLCRSPWPNSHQVNVSIIPPEHEAQDVAGPRRSGAGGVPYLSLTEGDRSGAFYTRGTIEGAPRCDHQCKLIRRFESDDAQWSRAMQWARPRWASWLSSGQPIENGRLTFGTTAEKINAQSPQALVAELSR